MVYDAYLQAQNYNMHRTLQRFPAYLHLPNHGQTLFPFPKRCPSGGI